MQSDWNVECGADDPFVAIPWTSEDGAIYYIDLREMPVRVKEISDAGRFPCVAAALLQWNRPDSPIFTAKCDVWTYAADLFDANDLPEFAYAHACYIDLLSVDAAAFSSFTASEAMLKRWNDLARSIPQADSRCEWTLRSARISTDQRHSEGFATTLYIWGYGPSPESAALSWSATLLGLIEPVFSNGFSV